MRKARNRYQLQRGVPKDVQPVIGKTIWVETVGSTYRVVQRLSPAFAAKTDRLIAEARNEVLLTGEALIDSLLNGLTSKILKLSICCLKALVSLSRKV